MGCSCTKNKVEQNEIINDFNKDKGTNIKEIDEENNDRENKLNFNNLKTVTSNTECITLNQERSSEIFDFFEDLRISPQKYIEESKQYDLENIISSAEIRVKSENNINILIKNPFFNLFLDTFVQKYPNSKENIMNSLNNNKNIEIYKKFLYSSKAPIDNPKECVWNLLKENKDIALDEILYKKIDYFMVSTISFSDTKTIIAYFLFLKKKLSI